MGLLVSIVIPTWNSEKYLAKCLESIRHQTYMNIEVIVVDKGSRDETATIARTFDAIVFERGQERTSQFNYGARKAHGEFIYYIGSDFVLDRRVVEEAITVALRDKADAVVIPNYSDPSVSFWAKVRALERRTYVGDQTMEAARFFKREVFENVGGYDENMVAYEEHDLHNRLVQQGYKIARITGVKELHIGEPRTLWEIIRKHYYYGQTIGLYIHEYPKRAIAQLSPVRPSFIRHWRTFATHPILTGGFVVYQTTRYTAAAAGYMWSRMVDGMSQKVF